MKRIKSFFIIMVTMLLMNCLVIAQDTTLTVTSAGNVGIGTSAPSLPLEIQGPGNSFEDLGMEFENTTSGQRFVLYNDGTSGSESFNIAQPLEFPSLTILATGNPGNVGIGTTSPGQKLSVAGTIESTLGGIKFPDGTVQSTAAAGAGTSLWSASGSDIFYDAGNVGIGTPSPSEQLHVWGNLQLGDPTKLWTTSSDNRIIKFGDGELASIGEVGGNNRLRIMGNPINMEGDMVIHGDISMGGGFGMVGDFIVDGNIGIGKPSSGSRLEINDNLTIGPMLLLNNENSSGDVAIDFHSAGVVQANIYYEPTGDYLSINSTNTSNTVLNAAGGSVGIGTTSPSQKLTVAGTIESISGGFKFPDGTTQTSAAGGGGSVWTVSGSHIFYNSGNVGVGTANPEAYLEVHGLGGYGKNGRVLTSAGEVKAFFDARDEGTTKELGQLGTKTNHDFAFYTNDSERMRITNNGNVGIGTTTPTLPLEIQGPGNFYQDLGMEFENTTSGQRFVLYNDATSGFESFNIAQPTETPSLTIMAAGNPGNVGIGTNSPNYKLHVNGNAAGTSWTNLSSRDYKENITRINPDEHQKMLKELIEVDISTYKYKEEFGGDGTTKLGFIAEEMPKPVLSKDGKGVDVYALLAYTIGALKAQQKKIEELEERLNK